MLFDSLQFAFFFVVVLGLYHALPFRQQNLMLLVASNVFYGAWDYRFLALIWISTLIDYLCSRKIDASSDPAVRKRFVTLSIASNLSVLGFFKYFNFFTASLESLLGTVGWTLPWTVAHIILPVGISFYTFQSLSYTIDVYRRELKPPASLLDFALFLSFFPQLVAGPIERATHLLPQMLRPRTVTRDDVLEGCYLILWGLTKKMAIADNLAGTVTRIFSKSGGFESGEVLTGALFFAFQIYCDFSSYSDIARGTAKLMGFNLMFNFNLPYFARNPSDFWRRWHISLSTWLRDYLYFPLGGSRQGAWRTSRNLMITMLLGGLWHGASWNFVLWGLFHGAILVGHRLFSEARKNTPALEPARAASSSWSDRATTEVVKWASIALMFVFTLYGWLLFRAHGLDQILAMSAAFFDFSLTDRVQKDLLKLAFFTAPLVVLQILQYRSGDLLVMLRRRPLQQAGFYVACFYLIVLIGDFGGQSFIYFQF